MTWVSPPSWDILSSLSTSVAHRSPCSAAPTRGIVSRVELLIDDPEAHTLCHPTNCAFRGTELFNSNLGCWHVTRTEVGMAGLPLP
jgi:hypothetical protein